MDAKVKVPCQAVVIRYVHDVLTGEALNIGLVLMCPAHNFVQTLFVNSWARITAAFPGADLVVLRRVEDAVQRAVVAWSVPPKKSLLTPPPRVEDVRKFAESVIPPEDAAIQVGPVVSGITANPERTTRELFHRYVGRYAEPYRRVSREDADVWQTFAKKLPDPAVLTRIEPRTLRVAHMEQRFEHAWKNGRWNVAQPLSLDLVEPRSIKDKAMSWVGRIKVLRPSEQDTDVFLLIGLPGRGGRLDVQAAASDALAVLADSLAGEAKVVIEEQSDPMAEKIVRDLKEHPPEPEPAPEK
jgi:hypothetical protein